MPEWRIHDKWAKKMGISEDISNFVNNLIDFPRRCREFQEFCNRDLGARIFRGGRATHMNIGPIIEHDFGRRKRFARESQSGFLSQKGKDYLVAYYLHQILDYISWWCKNYTDVNIEDILENKRVQKKIGPSNSSEIQNIKHFILKNAEEVLQDCR
ncbi:MAG: hypothetical protein NC831_06460 [Candidatus Omnitrophica bacterium]|nr:hypothetical protein [Candidatus Omnitrophota bacterium]MCM8827809.1 hypothetical protein [Candidatus Omnitrophota bacterium]